MSVMNLNDLSLSELKEKAKEEGIKNISKFKKDELINILSEHMESESESTHLKTSEESNFKEITTEDGYKLTSELDEVVEGILEVLPDGYGF